MANEKKISGSDFMLFIDPAGGTDFKLIVCLTEQNYNRATNKIDAKSKCGPDSLPGAQDVEVDFKGQIVFNPATGTLSEFFLNSLWQDKTTIGWKLARVTPQLYDSIYFGTAFISKLNASYGQDTVSSFDGALGIYGLPTALQVIRPEAPEVVSLNDNTGEIVFTPTAGYDATAHEYSTDNGVTWSDCVGATITVPILDIGIPNGDFRFTIRVKAGLSNVAGTSWVVATSGFTFTPHALTVTSEDDTLNRIVFIQKYGSLQLEASDDSGATWTSIVASPLVVAGTKGIGVVQIRVKANAGSYRNAGDIVSNTIAFTA